MTDRTATRGYVFVSADYRLLPESNGFDIIADIKDLWTFITSPELKIDFAKPDGTTRSLQIDPNSIAIGGSSAGGYCAYLAAIHCKNPQPKAILSIYGMGGQIFVSSIHTLF